MISHPIPFSAAIGYAVSVITATCGVFVLLGFFLPKAVPENVRITFGIVIVLLGIYRFAVTRLRSTQSNQDADE
ncbi:MAG TPA: hypothetical protein VNN76_11445 [Bacteroidota bacterium]|nr:hypothetical protein [Bacteroidota bacterium]